jgi:asparagine synthase (glutamine-hydrolysing)
LCRPCEELDLFRRPKRGFNPPLERWLKNDLASRLDAAGDGLEAHSGGQIGARQVRALVERHRGGERRLAERVLQLAILAESLGQLKEQRG